jgi:hypothetical protein
MKLMLSDKKAKLIFLQGFHKKDIENNPDMEHLVSWTPLSCATSGIVGISAGGILSLILCPCILPGLVGIWIGAGWYFIILGLLTLTGGLTGRSIYDRIYNLVFSGIFKTTKIPKHGSQRKFGCAIGGVIYIISGTGFIIGNYWLGLVPVIFLVSLAFIAGFTNWCFASSLYNLLFKKRNKVESDLFTS